MAQIITDGFKIGIFWGAGLAQNLAQLSATTDDTDDSPEKTTGQRISNFDPPQKRNFLI
jgi:hypothetical protein